MESKENQSSRCGINQQLVHILGCVQANNFCLGFITICWYAPAQQMPPNPVEAKKVLAIDRSVKWPSRQIDPKNR
jgi:hypothetical protein